LKSPKSLKENKEETFRVEQKVSKGADWQLKEENREDQARFKNLPSSRRGGTTRADKELNARQRDQGGRRPSAIQNSRREVVPAVVRRTIKRGKLLWFGQTRDQQWLRKERQRRDWGARLHPKYRRLTSTGAMRSEAE